MQDTEIKNMWKTYDRMIEESKILNLQSWALNLSCFETLQIQKAKSKLKTLIIPKIAGIILGIGWMLFLGFLFYYTRSQIFMAISLGMIIIFTIIAIISYIQDIAIIAQISYGNSVIETQKKIAFLQSSIINTIRILWLQLPFYTTFYITNKLVTTGGVQFWIIQIPVTLLFIWLSIFLFKNISLKNTHKKWVRSFIKGYGLSRVSKAVEFINEIDEFKKDIVL
jgi:hypothetical protein